MDNTSKNKYSLGIKNSVLRLLNEFVIITMLHSSFVAPCQGIYTHFLDNLMNSIPSQASYTDFSKEKEETYEDVLKDKYSTQKTSDSIGSEQILKNSKKESLSKKIKLIYNSDIHFGEIGKTKEKPIDSPTDNLFKIVLDEIPAGYDAQLKYDLFGVTDVNSVSKSLNDRPSTGGYAFNVSNQWSEKTEIIKTDWLHKGENKILFTVPAESSLSYKIRNLRIEFLKKNKTELNQIYISNGDNIQLTKGRIYIKGFIKSIVNNLMVTVDTEKIDVFEDEFEGIITLTNDQIQKGFVMLTAYDNSGILGQEPLFFGTENASQTIVKKENFIEGISKEFKKKVQTVIEGDGTKLLVPADALPSDLTISLTKLRKIDMPPLNSGMINVTKGSGGYRYLPDGTQFAKPIQIELEYDKKLLPPGYSANDIKTYFFNTNSRAWEVIERDSVDIGKSRIISQTTHFTDYINGIIQVPESPQTSAFVPTMMSDIKAADPSSEMTLISPPEVSQKGSASISYPIKIPSGRRGMQPQLAIQYSNEGGSSWLGQGWGLSIPSVCIDTRWGTPNINEDTETEIYTLGGEQLMYPPLIIENSTDPENNKVDWMPNRHYDDVNGEYNTAPRSRIPSEEAFFTPRKQGSFVKIQRLGNSPDEYYWKVTNTDGTINWYGGDETGLNSSAILKQPVNHYIVWWGLVKTEDVFGNNVKYYYHIEGQQEDDAIDYFTGSNSNLNAGTIANIDEIVYTGKNEEVGKYKIKFNPDTNLSNLRPDQSINSRLGFKQIDPYLLANIQVFYEKDLIRQYNFTYETARFGKKLLKKVSEFDGDEKEFYSHEFEYYDDIAQPNEPDLYFNVSIIDIDCEPIDQPDPCDTDTDGDGVNDCEDDCVNQPGLPSNNGCPEESLCHVIKINLRDYSQIVINTSQGPFNLGAYNFITDPNAVNSLWSVLDSLFPSCGMIAYHSTSENLININNWSIQCDFSFYSLTLTESGGSPGTIFFTVMECPSRPAKEMNYSNFFSSKLQEIESFPSNFTVVIQNPIGIDPCDAMIITGGGITDYNSVLENVAASLGSTKSNSGGVNFSISPVGLKCNGYTKNITVPFGFSYGENSSKLESSLIDIDGDGLEDIVRVTDYGIFYRKHIISRSYNDDGIVETNHSFSIWKPITTNGFFTNFYKQSGSYKAFDISVHVGGNSGAGGLVGYDLSRSKGKVTTYFTDANGDGLIDVVKNEIVYFNRLDSNGNPSFYPESENTPNMLITAGVKGIDEPEIIEDFEINIPAYDVVKVWEAPADGEIRITGDINLLDATKEALASIEMHKKSIETVCSTSCHRIVLPLKNEGNVIINTSNGSVNLGFYQFDYPLDQSFIDQINQLFDYCSPEFIIYNENFLSNTFEIRFSNCGLCFDSIVVDQGDKIVTYLFEEYNCDICSLDFDNDGVNDCQDICPYNTGFTTNNGCPFNCYEAQFSVECEEIEIINETTVTYTEDFNNGIPNSWAVYNNSFGSTQWATVNAVTNPPIVCEGTTSAFVISGENIGAGNTSEKWLVSSQVTIPDNGQLVFSTRSGINGFQNTTYQIRVSTLDQFTGFQIVAQWSEADLTQVFNICEDKTVDLIDAGFSSGQNIYIAFVMLVTQPGNGPTGDRWIVDNVKIQSHTVQTECVFPEETAIMINNNLFGTYDLINDSQTFIDDFTASTLCNGCEINVIENGFDGNNVYQLQFDILDTPSTLDFVQRHCNETIYNTLPCTNCRNQTSEDNDCSLTPEPLCLLEGVLLNENNTSEEISITNYSQSCDPSQSLLTVKKGDRIYFRLHHIETGNPPVGWNPSVEYVSLLNNGNLNAVDENGFSPLNSSYSDSFVLSRNNLKHMIMGNGEVTVSWENLTIPPLSDDISINVIHETTTFDLATGEALSIDENAIFSSQFSSSVLDQTLTANSFTFSVTDSDQKLHNLIFKISSTSNVNWKGINWRPQVQHVRTSTIDNGTTADGEIVFTETKYPIVDYTLFKKPICADYYVHYTLPESTESYILEPDLTTIQQAVGTSSGQSIDDGNLYLVVKSNGVLIGKTTVTISSGVPAFSSPITIPGDSGPIEINFTKDCTQQLYGTNSIIEALATTQLPLATLTTNSNPTGISLSRDQINFYHEIGDYFGSFYRNWGEFLYNPSSPILTETSTELVEGISFKLIEEDKLDLDDIDQDALDFYNGLESQLSGYINAADPQSVDPDTLIDEIENLQNDANNVQLAFIPLQPKIEINEEEDFIERYVGLGNENYSAELGARTAAIDEIEFSLEEEDDGVDYSGEMFTGAYGINKSSYSSGKNISFGGKLSFGGLTFSKSINSYSKTLSDYADFNGDRYPDIFTKSNIQYTNRTGGLVDVITRNTIVSGRDISRSNADSFGAAASGTLTGGGKKSTSNNEASRNEPRQDSPKSGTDANQSEKSSPAGTSGTFGVNINTGEDETIGSWIDVNGDGLTDYVYFLTENQLGVKMNLGGENFTETAYPFNQSPFISNSSTFSLGLSGGVGFNFSGFSAAGGLSVGESNGSTDQALIDMNGDGLVDKVISSSDGLIVDYNYGNKFSNQMDLTDQFNNEKNNKNTTVSANANFTFGLPIYIPIANFCIKIASVTLGGNASLLSYNRTKKTITDFDGDGFPDLLEESNPGQIILHRSNIKRTNLLKTVYNPLGGSFTIDYEVKTKSYNNPNAKWVMKSVEVYDGYDLVNDGVDNYKKSFVYENGKYDRRERDFYGFETVKVIDYRIDEQGEQESVYRTSVTKYHNNSYFLNGLTIESMVYKGEESEEEVFSKTENEYEIRKLKNNNTEIDIDIPAEDLTFDVGGTEGRRTAAVLLTNSKNYIYELGTNFILSETTMTYDEKGRVKRFDYLGDPNITEDDYYSTVEYHSDTQLIENNIISIPSRIQVRKPDDTLMRERMTDNIDVNTGTIGLIRAAINSTEYAETSMEYNAYGNLVMITYPENDNQESMVYKYTYDSEQEKYIVSIKDAFGYESLATYNPRFDAVVVSTDLAGNNMKYKYDSFGRVKTIVGPKELENQIDYTIEFKYFPKYQDIVDMSYQSFVSEEEFVPVALTKHYDSQAQGVDEGNTIDTYTFVDGLARPVQVKKDITLNRNSDPELEPEYYEAMSVSGAITYDEFGRGIKQYHPSFEGKSNSINFRFNINETEYFSETLLDELDRPVKSIDPDGNESEVQYFVENNLHKTKTIVDQNDTAQLISESHKDANGRVVKTINIGAADSLETLFDYNAIGELNSYTDAQGMSTTYVYDQLGRKVKTTHPDNGVTKFYYDKASNLTKLQTANLANNSNFIDYIYEINRLVEIKFPEVNGQPNVANVIYKYGEPNTGNQSGRLIYQQDATGTQDFEYGNMGEMILNRRIITSPSPDLPVRTFETTFQYDSWNRLTAMQYPDGEKVAYSYDRGGNLNGISGSVSTSTQDPYPYIKRIDYDHFEQRTYLQYGNNTKTVYNYTPSLRRLSELKVRSTNLTGDLMLNNRYQYDKVGNVTALVNGATFNSSNNLGGAFNHSYEYDDFNRLATASGRYNGNTVFQGTMNDYASEYDLRMIYNKTHGIVNKRQNHTKNGNVAVENTYVNGYKYINGTHKVAAIIDSNSGQEENFAYDSNGNMTNRAVVNGNASEYFWDESNRLRVVNSDFTMQHYIYDASGERVLKASSQSQQVSENGQVIDNSITWNNYTTYPSAFIVVDADGRFSKHYYAGTQRISSQMGATDASIFEEQEPAPREGTPQLDWATLKKRQTDDLQYYLDKAKRGKATFKAYKSFKDKEQEEDEEAEEQSDQASRAPEQGNLYFYHPDHLGTATYLTDINGLPYQFFLNLPFGESMAEQHSQTEDYENRWKFNGKEFDKETGLYYYGARYYDPRISIWASVDPLAEKMPSWSPYSYCFNSPVRFVDADGRIPIIPWLLKAGAGAAADMLAQAGMDYLFNPNTKSWGQAFDNVNWYQVGRSGLEGLIPWKTPGGRLGRSAVTAIGDVLINAMNDPSGYTSEQAGMDFVTGFIGDLAGGGFADLITKYGSKSVANGLMHKLGMSYGEVMGMMGGGVKSINKTVNGVTSTRMMQGWAKGKVAVIGRDMDNRVIPFADGMGAEYWKGWNPKLSDAENLANNKAWVQGLKDQGYTIYDLGTGPKSNQKGAFYGMETKEIFGDK